MSDYNEEEYDSDSSYQRQQSQQLLRSSYQPEVINFIQDFQTLVITEPKDVEEHHALIKNCYEIQWNKLSDKYFKQEPWPSVEFLAKAYDFPITQEFAVLYTELYYRHIFNKSGSTKKELNEFSRFVYEKFKSWDNYVDLFNLIINTEEVPVWNLPAQWLWDIMDEFIYQFTQYRHYRSKLQGKTTEELEFLEEYENRLWGMHSVLNVLYKIVAKSNIVESLSSLMDKNRENRVSVSSDNPFAENPMYRYLGYFSLIGLLRFHVITGDYQLAIDSMQSNPIELLYEMEDYEWFITTHYYYGFALVMTKQYKEAIKRFQQALAFIERTQKSPTRQIQYKVDQQNKQVEHLYHLLAICVTLYPVQLEDAIDQKMREKVGDDKLNKMNDGDNKVFEDLFNKASPKFVPLGSPELESMKSTCFVNNNTQKKVFVDEIKSQLELPAIRRYLKLYTTMELPKLSSFLSKNATISKDRSTLSHLMTAKVKMAVASGEDFNKTCPSISEILNEKVPDNDDEDDKDSSNPTVDFYVDNDMVHIADTKVEWTFGKNFLKLIKQYRDIESQTIQLGKK